MMASVSDTVAAINDACRARGGAHAHYNCTTVSWDDVQRGSVDGALSCWGSNITDTRLQEKNGRQLFTVRPDNWNEKLGKVSTGEIAVLIGNEEREGAELKPITLRQYLKNIGKHGSYAGLKPGQMLHEEAHQEVSIRFQTTFLPVEDDGSSRETLEFAPEAYNYNTTDDRDPRNLVLLCTTQGTAVQQDGKGAKKLYHHAVDAEGVVHRYWLEAEASGHKVGGPQKETAEEKADALARGKATSSVIGVRAMGTRFNVLMTIQVPLKQKPRKIVKKEKKSKKMKKEKTMKSAKTEKSWIGYTYMCGAPASDSLPMECSSCEEDFVEDDSFAEECMDMGYGGSDPFNASACAPQSASIFSPSPVFRSLSRAPQSPPRRQAGRASAARVSRGSEQDVWSGLSVEDPKRNEAEHVTVTVVMYNTVAGGVPSEEDVAAAVEDMEALYSQCAWNGRLADEGASFMKAELTVADAHKIANKVAVQPYVPASRGVVGGDAFPMDDVGSGLGLGGWDPLPAAPLHSNIICDACKTEHRITGDRYHKKGEDYDICSLRFEQLSAAKQSKYEMISHPGAVPVDMATRGAQQKPVPPAHFLPVAKMLFDKNGRAGYDLYSKMEWGPDGTLHQC